MNSRFGGFLLLASNEAHFTGDPGCAEAPGGSVRRVLPFVAPLLHPARTEVDRADDIGVVLIATNRAGKAGLRLAVLH